MSRFFLDAQNGDRRLLLGRHPPPMKLDCSLPEPTIKFYSPERPGHCGTMDFMLVDGGKKVVATDGVGGAFMYDADAGAVRSLPSRREELKKPFAFAVAAGNDLYLMDMRRRRFEALAYPPPRPSRQGHWHWRDLPPPPPGLDDDLVRIDAGAVVGFGSRGAASPRTGRCSSAAAPSCIPELGGLWFGISSADRGHVLCASDLAVASEEGRPPVAAALLDDDMAGAPKEWRLVSAPRSVYLGSGKFCIARFFNVRTPRVCYRNLVRYEAVENFITLAGVEVVSGHGGELRLVKHYSERYVLDDFHLYWLL